MDYILLAIVISLSLLWASVFNSTDNPMENQPINVVIDIKRNLLQFDSFLGYFVQFFLIYFCGYFFYWVNHHILVNKIMARFGVFHYLWVAVLFTLVASPTLSQLALFLPINSGDFTLLPSGNQDPFDNWNLQIAAVIMIFSLPLILSFKWLKQEAELAHLKQENVQSELKWLQQQINPHFLFNTLNNLYSLTLSKSDKAPESILQLASLLRFVVYQGGKSRVTMEDEIQYLSDYIALQSIRVKHKATISFDIDPRLTEQAKQLSIAPLLLVMLVENAFKHGVDKTDKDSWLNLSIALREKTLIAICHNSVEMNSVEMNSPSTAQEERGMGFNNLSRRLELIYKNKHQFEAKLDGDEFLAKLELELEFNA
jgi:sensor histidine kinase YesM